MSKHSRRVNMLDANAALRSIADRLVAFEATIDNDTLGRIIRAQATDPGGRGSPPAQDDIPDEDRGQVDYSDPTGAVALMQSKARADERTIDRLLASIQKQATQVERIVTYWLTDIPAKAEELARLEREANPGCEVVGAIKRPGRGPAYWEESHRTTDLGGLLQRPYRLGRWAYDFVRAHGRLPVEAEVRAHLDGKRVRVRA